MCGCPTPRRVRKKATPSFCESFVGTATNDPSRMADLDLMIAEAARRADASQLRDVLGRKKNQRIPSDAAQQGSWTCPICSASMPYGTHPKYYALKSAHIRQWHPHKMDELRNSTGSIVGQTNATIVDIPLDVTLAWRCPLCTMGIMQGTRWQINYAIRQHKKAHPGAPDQVFSRKHLRIASLSSSIAKAQLAQRTRRRVRDIAHLRESTHKHVEFVVWPIGANKGRMRLLCLDCRRMVPTRKGLDKFPCNATRWVNTKTRQKLIAALRDDGSAEALRLAEKLGSLQPQ